MRCLIDYGVRPGDLQAKLKSVPTEEKVPVDLEAVLEAEARLERHLEFSLRSMIDDPEMCRLLAQAYEQVRQFRTHNELGELPAKAQAASTFPAAASHAGALAGTALQ